MDGGTPIQDVVTVGRPSPPTTVIVEQMTLSNDCSVCLGELVWIAERVMVCVDRMVVFATPDGACVQCTFVSVTTV